MKPIKHILCLAGILWCTTALAADIVWTNTTGGNWNVTDNWSPNTIPGTNDIAVITNAGVTVSLNGATTVGGIILGGNGAGLATLALNNQTLTLNGPLTVNPGGSFTVDGGAVVGNSNAVLSGAIGWTGGSLGGTLTLASNGTLLIAGGGGNLYMNNFTLTNYGTVAWSSGNPDGGGTPATLIYNYGLWDCQGDYYLKADNGGNGVVFNNFGTLRKSVGTNTSGTVFPYNVVLNQSAGTLDLQQGNFYLDGGGNFTGGTATNNNGALYLYTGSFTLNGTLTGTNVIENGGNLVGTVVINGGLNWVSGNWSGASNVTLLTNSTLLIAGGGGNLYMNNFTLTNYGTVAWSSGHLDGGGTPATLIYNYGLWDCQGDYYLKADNGGNGVVFNNYGTLRKSVGTNISQTVFVSGVVLNQLAGSLDLQQGNFYLDGGGNFTGGTATNNNGALYLYTGNFTLNGTAMGTNVIEYYGNLVGTVVINGGLNWVNGNWNGASNVTLLANSTLLIAGGGGNLYMNNCTLTNYGTVAWSSGYLDGGGTTPGTLIYNYGLWDCQGDYDLKGDTGGNGVVFNNYGTLRKSAGTNTSGTIFPYNVVLNQLAGELDLQQGNFYLESGGNFTGGTATNNNGALYLYAGNFTLNGTPTGTNVIEENSGNLVGANVIQGGLIWQGGYWNTAASVVIATNSTVIAAGGGANMPVNDLPITNYGMFVWSSGNLDGGGTPATLICNYGLWDCQGDYVFKNDYGGAGTIIYNYGVFRKSAGTGTTTISASCTNTSSIQVNSGTLSFSGGGVTAGTGSFAVTSGATLDLSGGAQTFNPGSSVAGAGTFSISGAALFENGTHNVVSNLVSGGIWNLNSGAPVALGTLNVSGGTLDCSNAVNVSGPMVWSGGTITGNNTISANGGLTITGSTEYLYVTLVNGGAGSWSSSQVNCYGTAMFSNAPTATFDFTTDGSAFSSVSGSPALANAGTLRKTAGAGTTTVSVPCNNSGSVQVNSGILSFGGNFVQSGGQTTLNGGSFSFAQTAQLCGGTLYGAGAITGSISNSATVSPGVSPGILTISGNYTEAANSHLEIELGGTTPGAGYDQLSVGGTATLAGTLDVSYYNGFVPAPGILFTAVVCNARSGVFSAITAPTNKLGTIYTAKTVLVESGYAAPTVQLNVNSIQIACCHTVLIQASGSAPDGTVTNLTVLLETNVLASLNSASGTVSLSCDFPGEVTITALATDNNGASGGTNVIVNFVTLPVGVLDPVGFQTNRSFKLCLEGVSGTTNVIEAGDDLTSGVWTNLGTMENTNGIWRYSDKTATNSMHRLYRARQLP